MNTRVEAPEFVLVDHETEVLGRLKKLAILLDKSIGIPGTRYRIGLDPILGLAPGIGDVISALLSLYIVWESIRLGIPNGMIARMLINVGIDTVIGTVPVFGDAFDAAWKSNIMNVALLEKHLNRRKN